MNTITGTDPSAGPGVPACEMKDVDQAAHSQGRGSLRGTILVVDDDPIILKTSSMRLGAAGYDVFTALGPSEAITAVGSHKLDIIILDVNFPPDVPHGGMPSWDGPRLMCWLRTLKGAAEACFIIITADNLATVKKDSLSSPAIGFFQKPLDYKLLLATIAKQLGGNSGATSAV